MKEVKVSVSQDKINEWLNDRPKKGDKFTLGGVKYTVKEDNKDTDLKVTTEDGKGVTLQTGDMLKEWDKITELTLASRPAAS